MFFSECGYFSKHEIRDIVELIEAKCLSKAEIIELITDNCSKNPCQNGHCYSGRNCNIKHRVLNRWSKLSEQKL